MPSSRFHLFLNALILILILACQPAAAQQDEDSLSHATKAPASRESAPGTAAVSPFEDDPFALDPFAESGSELVVADPLEGLNRAIFKFNDTFYFYLFKPVARGWRILPEPGRKAIDRAFLNLGAPVRMVNSLLQLRLKKTVRVIGRFAVNSTLGLLGLFDPADSWLGLKRVEEDFGQTLGHYGAGPGFYLVLPFLGPASLRDGLGLIGDIYTYPITSPLVDWRLGSWEALGVESVRRVNQLSLDAETYEGIKMDALDPYLEIRNGYTQRRELLISQ